VLTVRARELARGLGAMPGTVNLPLLNTGGLFLDVDGWRCTCRIDTMRRDLVLETVAPI
jgi:hypothetical protein